MVKVNKSDEALTCLVLDEIEDERTYQRDKFGNDIDDKHNTVWHWVTWITRYVTSFTNGSWNADLSKFRKSMIKTAALAVAAVEWVDRKDG